MVGGSGLGLSIVKKITVLLSADLIFSSGATGVGLKIQVVFGRQTPA